jgi:hypothetical protein
MSNKSITNQQADINAKENDFLLVCPSPSGIADAIHALYYLPQNYRLVVLSQAVAMDDAMSWAAQTDMMGRIQFESKMGLTNGTSPFSSADAVISDTVSSEVADTTPMVVASGVINDGITSTGENRFAVSADSPEALASAILRIAKAAPRVLTRSEIHQYA